jgi:hypothetical protein
MTTANTTTTATWNTTRTKPFLDDPRQISYANLAWKQGVLGALNVAALILSVRLILLVAVVGAFLLTWQTLADPQTYKVIATSAFMALTVLPAVWLSGRGPR